MANEKVVASLVGKLSWQADHRPLASFEKRLDAVAAKMKSLNDLAKSKVTVTLKLNEAAWSKKVSQLQRTNIQLSNISVASANLTAVKAKIKERLDTTKILFKDVKVSVPSLVAMRAAVKESIQKETFDINVMPKWKQALDSLKTWRKKIEDRWTIRFNATINKAKFYQNAKAAVDSVTKRIGTLQIVEPKIKLSVDRPALRAEIASVLREIERQAKIKIQLNAGVSGGGGGGGSSGGRGPMGARQSMLAGGVAGTAATWGRGFIPGLSGAFAVSHLNRLNQELQAQDLALTAVTGSEDAAKAQKEWVRNLTSTLGVVTKDTLPAYTRMLASGTTSGYSTESVQNIFTGVSAYGRTMGLDPEAMKGTLRAVEQIINKGQVMSEELKGQLAERAPGVVSAMAEAAGFGTDPDAVAKLFEAMERGEVKSRDVMERFSGILLERAKQGGALEKAMQAVAAQQARFTNAWHDSVRVFGLGGFENQLGEFFGHGADEMGRATPLVKALGGAFEYLMRPVNAVVISIGKFGEQLPKIAQWAGVSEKALLGFMGLFALNLTPIGRVVTLLGGMALAIEDVIKAVEGKDSYTKRWFDSLTPEDQNAILSTGTALRDLADAIKGLVQLKDSGKSFFESVTPFIKTTAEEIRLLAEAVSRLIQDMQKLAGFKLPNIRGAYTPAGMIAEAPGAMADRGGILGIIGDIFGWSPRAERVKEAYDASSVRQRTLSGQIGGGRVEQSNSVIIQKIEIANPNAAPSDIASAINSSIQDAFSLHYSSMRGNIAPAR